MSKKEDYEKYLNYHTETENNVSIFKNVLINVNTVTAYYVLYPFNYDLMDRQSAERHVEKLYSVLNNLYSIVGELKCSIFQLKNIVSKQETIDAITQTIRNYKKDYKGFPAKYRDYIRNITKDYSILAININVKQNVDIETQNLMSILKEAFDTFVKENFSMNVLNINEEQINNQNSRIKNTLARYAIPANEKLVMNIYINSLFPSYNLVYTDYMTNDYNRDAILAGVTQEIIPHLGWFEMSNSGIVAFGGKPRTTYGSVIAILKFPESIVSENFNIAIPGLCVNMKLLQKKNAVLRFRRIRADIREEGSEADQVESLDSDTGSEEDLAQFALNQIKNGRIITDVDANILLTADSKEELDKKKKNVIQILSEIDGMVASIAADQAKTFINSFVRKSPTSYQHCMDLQYALSFQLDNGLLVGHTDSDFASPVIGISS